MHLWDIAKKYKEDAVEIINNLIAEFTPMNKKKFYAEHYSYVIKDKEVIIRYT